MPKGKITNFTDIATYSERVAVLTINKKKYWGDLKYIMNAFEVIFNMPYNKISPLVLSKIPVYFENNKNKLTLLDIPDKYDGVLNQSNVIIYNSLKHTNKKSHIEQTIVLNEIGLPKTAMNAQNAKSLIENSEEGQFVCVTDNYINGIGLIAQLAEPLKEYATGYSLWPNELSGEAFLIRAKIKNVIFDLKHPCPRDVVSNWFNQTSIIKLNYVREREAICNHFGTTYQEFMIH